MRLSPVLLLLSYQFCFVSCFSTTTKILHQHHITPLWAKPRRNAKKKTNSGGGFGAPPPAAPEKKVRSVSGYTGSGTKPLRVAANTFDKLRKDFGAECTSDVYVRSPLNDNETFWFVGKIARCTNAEPVPTEEEAVLSQKRLILEYAKHQLRPQNFGGPYAKALELWLAPGDSEMDTVQNKITLKPVLGSASDISDTFDVANVGFNPEIYVGDEVKKGGLRVVRDDEGRPVKPVFDINQSA